MTQEQMFAKLMLKANNAATCQGMYQQFDAIIKKMEIHLPHLDTPAISKQKKTVRQKKQNAHNNTSE